MKTLLVTVVTAFALAALAGCDRNPQQQRPGATPPSQAGAGATGAQSNTPTTPANAGTPSEAEKKDGANPTQGQVDPKQPEQHKDFQHRGDAAGPKQ